jgi:DNA-binding NarL/FixJ family response regulator
MATQMRRLTAVVLGDAEPVVRLLVDLAADARIELNITDAGLPDVVFAVVREGDFFRVLERAKRLSAGAPIVAVLQLRDERMTQRAFLAGATSVCTLDASLDALRAALSAALARLGPVDLARPV